MQTSLDPKDWREDHIDEMNRMQVRPETPHLEKRRLFPLSCRVLKQSRLYAQAQEGHIFMYARTKMYSAAYPIEVLAWGPGGYRQNMSFQSNEVDLLPPED